MTTATRRRPPAHTYVDDPTAPGTCATCHVPDPKRTNERHQLPDLAEATSEHRRRAGEK
jgi:cytochrome c553